MIIFLFLLAISCFLFYFICWVFISSFLFTLFFVFTIKLVADKELYTPYWQGKVQTLPLGNVINKLLIRLINVWKLSNILWIYFIMGSLLLAICFSTFAVYASLTGLKG